MRAPRTFPRFSRAALLAVVLAALVLGADACASKPTATGDVDAGLGEAGVDAARALDLDATTSRVAPIDAGRGSVVTIGAASFAVSVIDMPAWPESGTGSKRLGYLRAGAVTEVWDKPVVNDDCSDGWLLLVSGGWVCSKSVTTDLANPRVRLAPKQADRDAGLPYRYGVNVGDGTPLYRRVLAEDERKKLESAKDEKKKDDEKDKDKKGKSKEKDREKELAERAPSSGDLEREEAAARQGASAPDGLASPVAARPSSTDGVEVTGEDEPAQDPKAKDAGAPRPRLKDLRGRGAIVRKMSRGFYVGLDKDFRAGGSRWWRTTYGFAAPFDRIAPQTSVTKHHGAWFLDAPFAEAFEDAGPSAPVGVDGGVEDLAGAVGFATHGAAHMILPNEDRTKAGWGPELPKRSAVMLTGRTFKVDGVTYHEASATKEAPKGFWVRLGDLKLAKPTFPSDLREGEKWIDVDLTRQTLVAFEGRRPVFGTLISSGRRNPQDKEHDFPTPAGTFWIREKHVTTTMDGDVAADGPYSIEDVPWVMYFQGSYALHGAFWHDAFGNVRSHGCVNLAPEDARGLFHWADPPLPEGWHGVFAKDEKAGTRVVIHEDAPPKRHRRTPTPPPTE